MRTHQPRNFAIKNIVTNEVFLVGSLSESDIQDCIDGQSESTNRAIWGEGEVVKDSSFVSHHTKYELAKGFKLSFMSYSGLWCLDHDIIGPEYFDFYDDAMEHHHKC